MGRDSCPFDKGVQTTAATFTGLRTTLNHPCNHWLTHTRFFLRHDPRVSMARRVFGFATLGALGVILTNLLIYVAFLGASVLTVIVCLKLTGILP